MYKLSLCLLFVAIFGYALANVEEARATNTVSLHVSGSSSIWWVAVQPRNDGGATAKVEVKDSSASSTFVTLTPNPSWGYYSLSSPYSRGFTVPLTFRLTSSSGLTITVLVNTISDQLIDSGASYGSSAAPTTPTSKPSTPTSAAAPATAAPAPATAAPSRPTSAPPAAGTSRPTNPPTVATNPPVSTTRPTTPTTRPTTAPATPTTRPTAAATTRPVATTPPTADLCSIVSTKTEPIKLMVPLYVYPGAAWDTLIAAASKVGILAIVNPNSGPLATVDSSYSTYMTKLKNAGVEMVGYVYTSYGVRDLNAVKADIDTYASKYPLLTGIFLDEAANDASKISFYTQVYNYIKSKGYVHSILNPGVQPDQGYMAISSNIVIYENYATSLSTASYSSWVKCAPNAAQKAGYKYRFTGMVHTASASSQAAYVNTLANAGMGYVYITDGAGGCCTYNNLVSYFAQEATSVQTLNS